MSKTCLVRRWGKFPSPPPSLVARCVWKSDLNEHLQQHDEVKTWFSATTKMFIFTPGGEPNSPRFYHF